MEIETKIFLFFLIGWSTALQLVLTVSSSCFSTLERWLSFGIYVFAVLLFCGVRFGNYYKENKGMGILYKFDTSTSGILDEDINNYNNFGDNTV